MRPVFQSDAPTGDAPVPSVAFVGAGPGDPDLLTVRAVRALEAADVVLHDALGCGPALSLCKGARLVAIGKRAGGMTTEQAFINRQLVQEAASGVRVVRLKGGDPTVFGRLDEEISALVQAGISYHIVPGITAASAAAAAAGTSLTQRGVARGVVITTPATGRDEAINADWIRAAHAGSTVAVYMAGRALADTARAMMAAGFAPDTPTLVARAVSGPDETLHSQRLVQLATAGAAPAMSAAASGPCVLLVGNALHTRAERTAKRGMRQSATTLACTFRSWPSSQSSLPNSLTAIPPCSTASSSLSMPVNTSA